MLEISGVELRGSGGLSLLVAFSAIFEGSSLSLLKNIAKLAKQGNGIGFNSEHLTCSQ